jgi:hypothetical protein
MLQLEELPWVVDADADGRRGCSGIPVPKYPILPRVVVLLPIPNF